MEQQKLLLEVVCEGQAFENSTHSSDAFSASGLYSMSSHCLTLPPPWTHNPIYISRYVSNL